jgi:hypothetical protein
VRHLLYTVKEENHHPMTRRRLLTLLVVGAHWIVAVGHLFLAAEVLPAPNNSVSWLAITLITFGHLAVSIALWKLSDKLAGLVSLIFFLAASGADLYEHFLHASANNVFMVAPGDWTPRFDASVFVLLALEVVGCLLGILLLGSRTRNTTQTQVRPLSGTGANEKTYKYRCKGQQSRNVSLASPPLKPKCGLSGPPAMPWRQENSTCS